MMEMIKRGMPIEWEFLTHSFKNTSWTYELLLKGDACKAGDSLWLSCEAGDAQRWLYDSLMIIPVF